MSQISTAFQLFALRLFAHEFGVIEMRKRGDKTTLITAEMFTTVPFIISCLHDEQHLHSNNLLLPKERYADTA